MNQYGSGEHIDLDVSKEIFLLNVSDNGKK